MSILAPKMGVLHMGLEEQIKIFIYEKAMMILI
jgi:hypothetical protein